MYCEYTKCIEYIIIHPSLNTPYLVIDCMLIAPFYHIHSLQRSVIHSYMRRNTRYSWGEIRPTGCAELLHNRLYVLTKSRLESSENTEDEADCVGIHEVCRVYGVYGWLLCYDMMRRYFDDNYTGELNGRTIREGHTSIRGFRGGIGDMQGRFSCWYYSYTHMHQRNTTHLQMDKSSHTSQQTQSYGRMLWDPSRTFFSLVEFQVQVEGG